VYDSVLIVVATTDSDGYCMEKVLFSPRQVSFGKAHNGDDLSAVKSNKNKD
jgi:hypothetical protein